MIKCVIPHVSVKEPTSLNLHPFTKTVGIVSFANWVGERNCYGSLLSISVDGGPEIVVSKDDLKKVLEVL